MVSNVCGVRIIDAESDRGGKVFEGEVIENRGETGNTL